MFYPTTPQRPSSANQGFYPFHPQMNANHPGGMNYNQYDYNNNFMQNHTSPLQKADEVQRTAKMQ
jgi:hypothetical protein